MPRFLLVLLIALLPFAATAQTNQVTPGNTPAAACANGAWLGPYDRVTGLYDWACIDRPWSASYGGMDANGVSKYFTPTTRGGNSWTLKCTGDGTASNGTAAEGSICLVAGEEIKMYSDADVMLAADWIRPGGKLYGNGVYHSRYCGQSEGRIANGCPVTRTSPTHQTRRMSFNRGKMLVGGGKDPDGPHLNGRTSTWIIQDQGGDTDNSGPNGFLDVTDPGGTPGYRASHWAMSIGTAQFHERICARPPGSTGCDTRVAAVLDFDAEPFPAFGRRDSLVLEDITNPGNATGSVRVCVENRVSSGVCENDPRVRCTVNDGTARGADGVTGGCSTIGLGQCLGVATALDNFVKTLTDDTTNGSSADTGAFAVIQTYSQLDYGLPAVRTATSQAYLGSIRKVTATTCASGNGRYVQFAGFWQNQVAMSGGSDLDTHSLHPLAYPIYSQASQFNRFQIVHPSVLFNYGGGVSGINVMPGSWFNRRAAGNNAADCGPSGAAYSAACDDVDQVSMGSGVSGGIYDSTWWYGGSGNYAFSKIDGSTAGFDSEIKRNLFTHGTGAQTDASGWIFEDNDWMHNDADGASTPLVFVTFVPGFRMFRDRFQFNTGYSMISFQGANDWIIRDVEFESNYHTAALLDFRGARRGAVDGVIGHGNRGGPPISFNPWNAGWDIFDVDVRNVYLSNQQFAFSGTFQAHAIVAVEDFNGGAGGMVSGPVTVENVHASVHGDENWCAVFMAGGTGDDSAGNGSGTTIDDVRHLFSFKNISLERIDDISPTGTMQATCLGNWTGSEEEPPLPTFAASEGGMPRWENIRLNGVLYPDNPRTSMTAAQAGDCDALLQGTVVTVHDMPTANTCTDGANDGILDGGTAAPNQNTVTCKCTPGGTPKWAPL